MKLAVPSAPTLAPSGFTLVELAIVMFIVALFLGGMLLPLSAQQDIRNAGDTQKILAEARDALLGFAMANDRLPCPAKDATTGVESLSSPGVCSNPYDGFLPAVTLGLSPVDAQGYLLDGWGGESIHRVRYAISTANGSAFTTQNGMKTAGMTTLATPAAGDLKVCNTGVGMTNVGTATAACAAGASLAADAVAVIYSLGKNAGTGGAGVEENHNPNPRSTLVADPAFVNAQQGTAFDDQVVWLSKNTLFNRMVGAGRLP